jgi:hypothetical protein
VSFLKRIPGWLAMVAMVMLGLAAAAFIHGCGRTPEPSKPGPEQPPKPPADKPDEKESANGKKQVDRKEVEQGQPVPRNYLE